MVVGCDGNARCDPVLVFGLAEAERRDARLVVVTAYERDVDPDLPQIPTDSKLSTAAVNRARASLVRALGNRRAHSPVSVEIIALPGRPDRVLFDAVENPAAIVVGHHRGGLVQAALFGSTTGALLRHAEVPVVVVPAGP